MWDKKLVIGHRGAAAYAPENTLLSFHTAINMGADMVELDVQRTADGQLVCVHDYDLTRLCKCEGLISEMQYDDLVSFDLGNGQQIPLLRDVLNAMKGKAKVNIEIKVPEIESEVAVLLDDSGMSSHVVVSSFLHETLASFREIDDTTRTGVLFNEPLDDVASYANELGANCLHPLFLILEQDLIDEAHGEGLLVFPWTVNDPEMMLGLWEMDVDGLITDYPDLGIKSRKQFLTKRV